MAFLDREITRHDPFSKVLFYSVLLHYAIFFIFVGNPFLLLNEKEGSSEGERSMEVRLLSAPKEDGPEKAVRIPLPKPAGAGQAVQENLALSRESGDINADGDEAKAPTERPDTARPLHTGDLADLNAVVPPTAPQTKTPRKLPPNMTGPEDCMLKVVGMVCPSGTAECIEAYKAFCASLPQ